MSILSSNVTLMGFICNIIVAPMLIFVKKAIDKSQKIWYNICILKYKYMGREGSWPVGRIIEVTDNARKELWGVSPESLTGKGKKKEGVGESVKVLPKSSVEVAPRKTEVLPYPVKNTDKDLPDTGLGEEKQEEVERDFVGQERERKMTKLGSDKRKRNVGRHLITKYKLTEGGEWVEKRVSVGGKRYGDKYKDERKGRI